MAQIEFNIATTRPAGGRSFKFPMGDYHVEITNHEVKGVKNKQGVGYVAYTLKVIDGQYAGQSYIHRINLWSDKQQAVEIAQGELTALALVTGRYQITDTEQLVGGKLWATLGPQEQDERYSDLFGVKSEQGATPEQILGGQTQAQPQPQTQPQYPATSPAAPAQFGPPPPSNPQWGQPPTQPAGNPFGNAQPAAPPAAFQQPNAAPPQFTVPNAPPTAGFAPPQGQSGFGGPPVSQQVPPWANQR